MTRIVTVLPRGTSVPPLGSCEYTRFSGVAAPLITFGSKPAFFNAAIALAVGMSMSGLHHEAKAGQGVLRLAGLAPDHIGKVHRAGPLRQNEIDRTARLHLLLCRW